jgi:hypothetical protein
MVEVVWTEENETTGTEWAQLDTGHTLVVFERDEGGWGVGICPPDSESVSRWVSGFFDGPEEATEAGLAEVEWLLYEEAGRLPDGVEITVVVVDRLDGCTNEPIRVGIKAFSREGHVLRIDENIITNEEPPF